MLAQLRNELAARGLIQGATALAPHSSGQRATGLEKHRYLQLPGPLGQVLPGGGLPRRAVTQAQVAPIFITELLTAATQAGAYCALVGWEDLLLTEVASRGALARLVCIPNPGLEALSVLGLLAGGVDLIIYRAAAQVSWSATRARPLLAKLRQADAALVLNNAQLPSPALRLSAQVCGYHGLGQGVGRIKAVELEVEYQTASAPPQHQRLWLGQEPAPARPALQLVPEPGS